MGLAHVGEANRCDPCARAITVRELLERKFDRDVADENAAPQVADQHPLGHVLERPLLEANLGGEAW